MMKITRLSHIFKWENLHNWWLTKYFFAPLYIYIYIYIMLCIYTSINNHTLQYTEKIHVGLLVSYIWKYFIYYIALYFPHKEKWTFVTFPGFSAAEDVIVGLT